MLPFNRKEEFNQHLLNFVRVSAIDGDINIDPEVLNKTLKDYGHISLYNEIHSIQELTTLFEDAREAKTPRGQDEKEYHRVKDMMSLEDYSEFSSLNLYRRSLILTSSLDEKMILDLKQKLLYSRMIDLVYQTIENEI